MFHLLLEAGAPDAGMSLLSSFGLFIPVILVMYFLMIRPQKKREKAIQEMRSKLEVGDEITTVGGIIGRVVSMQDDTLVIETTSACTKLRVMRWAVQTNNTIRDAEPEKK